MTRKSILGAMTASALLLSAGWSTLLWAQRANDPVEVCHKPGTPAEHTIVVDDNAVPAHLRHGDVLGSCEGSGSGSGSGS